MNERLQEVLEGKEANYILPLFWVKGEDERTVRNELRRIREAGIRAVTVEPRPHPDYLAEGWWSIMDAVLDEARSLGMRVWLWDDDHFPTGHVAGQLKEGPAELRRLFLNARHIDALGPARWASFLIKPEGDAVHRTPHGEVFAVIAAKRDSVTGELTGEAVDVSAFVEEGVLYWPVPEGYWRLFIFETSDKGGSEKTKDYFNPIDRESVRLLIDTVHEAFYARYKDDFGHTLAGFFSDEPGFYNDPRTYDFESRLGKDRVPIPWSRELPALLEERLGSGYRLLLPCLFHAAGKQTDRVRYAYMDIVSKLYAEHFGMQIGRWCREHGVEYIGHILEDNNVHTRLGSGAGHYFRALWGQDMAGVDVVLWQLTPGFDEVPLRWFVEDADSEFFHYGMAKMATSLGHIDPKKQGRTLAEVFGAYGWAEGLKLMKWLTDHMLVRGVTHFSPHAFSAHAYPDPDCPPHLFAGGRNAQFRYYHHLNAYTNRISHLLAGGQHVASAAVLYHAEAEWSGAHMPFQKPLKELMRRQIDCDVLHCDGLLEHTVVRDGKLRTHAESFDCLIIPYSEALPEAVLRKLRQYADEGLPLVFLRALPSRSCEGLSADGTLPALRGHASVRTVELEELADYCRSAGWYEIGAKDEAPHLRAHHIRHSGLDVFMFFNEHPTQPIRTGVSLPVGASSSAPYRYDAFGNRLEATPYRCEANGIVLDLTLSPYESAVVVIGEAMPALEPEESRKEPEESRRVKERQAVWRGPWRISTATAEAYPSFTAYGTREELGDLGRPGELPRFSGTIRYETRVEWEQSSGAARLDLGDVYETAEVFVNGQSAGVRIAPPYRLEIGGLLRPGSNDIAIEVTNTLVKERRDFMSMYGQQEPTGLIGPVRIEYGG